VLLALGAEKGLAGVRGSHTKGRGAPQRAHGGCMQGHRGLGEGEGAA